MIPPFPDSPRLGAGQGVGEGVEEDAAGMHLGLATLHSSWPAGSPASRPAGPAF